LRVRPRQKLCSQHHIIALRHITQRPANKPFTRTVLAESIRASM
jgi:hypothetical protein